MSEEKQSEIPKPTFEISDSKDQLNALTEQAQKIEEKKDVKNNDTAHEESGTEKKKKPRAQKRIETLSAEKRELEKRVADLEAAQGKKTEASQTTDLDPDDFEDYDAYLDALDEQDKKAEKPKNEAPATSSDFQKVLDDIEIKFDDARDKYEDFDKLVQKQPSDGGPALTQGMIEAMNEFDNAGEIAYHLATNVLESIRIANLKPMKQILEINKLGEKLSKEGEKSKETAPLKKATNAPEPINALGGGSTPSNSLADAQNYQDYQALRKKQNTSRAGW